MSLVEQMDEAEKTTGMVALFVALRSMAQELEDLKSALGVEKPIQVVETPLGAVEIIEA